MLESWHDRFAESPDVLKTEWRRQTVIPVRDFEIGGDEFITMAGPCSVETEAQLMATARHVRCGGARVLRGGAFKPRSSPYSFQGLGLEGLKLLAHAREETGLAVVTEVMSEDDVSLVAEYADILQIGSRSMENFTLLEAAARSGRPILLKRGMVATIADFLRSAQCILSNGNPNVILCERGIRTFETAMRNTFDVAAIALLKQICHLPVIADPSHAAGRRELVAPAGAHCGGRGGRWAAGRSPSQPQPRMERRRPDSRFCRLRRHDGLARTLHRSPRSTLIDCRACRRRIAGGGGMTLVTRAAVAAFPVLMVVLLCGFSAETASVSQVPILVTSAPAYDALGRSSRR